MVHIYNDSGKELNVWNTGDFAKNDATEAEIRKSIQDHIKEYKTEYGRVEYDDSVE